MCRVNFHFCRKVYKATIFPPCQLPCSTTNRLHHIRNQKQSEFLVIFADGDNRRISSLFMIPAMRSQRIPSRSSPQAIESPAHGVIGVGSSCSPHREIFPEVEGSGICRISGSIIFSTDGNAGFSPGFSALTILGVITKTSSDS